MEHKQLAHSSKIDVSDFESPLHFFFGQKQLWTVQRIYIFIGLAFKMSLTAAILNFTCLNGAVDVTVLHFIIFQEDIHVVCFIIGMHINEFFYWWEKSVQVFVYFSISSLRFMYQRLKRENFRLGLYFVLIWFLSRNKNGLLRFFSWFQCMLASLWGSIWQAHSLSHLIVWAYFYLEITAGFSLYSLFFDLITIFLHMYHY